jgi:hypothetical protein
MKIILPLSVTLPRKTKADKVFMLNLNIYRNAHFQILNQAKIVFKDQMREILWDYVCMEGPLHFTYTVFPANNRAFDLGNVCSIIQKFTDDALVELEVIKDDSYKIVRSIDYRFGGVDKEHPRAELEITPYG